jgi:hypothetical protein
VKTIKTKIGEHEQARRKLFEERNPDKEPPGDTHLLMCDAKSGKYMLSTNGEDWKSVPQDFFQTFLREVNRSRAAQ